MVVANFYFDQNYFHFHFPYQMGLHVADDSDCQPLPKWSRGALWATQHWGPGEKY